MKNIFLFLIGKGILLLSINPVLAQPAELSFTIKLDKTTYKVNEPMKCSMILKNESAGDIVVNNRFLVNLPGGPLEVSFQLIGPDLKPAIFQKLINAPRKSNHFHLLHPGESVSKPYMLTGVFDISQKGQWNVAAYYKNKQDTPPELKLASAWMGQLVSNKVNFTIR